MKKNICLLILVLTINMIHAQHVQSVLSKQIEKQKQLKVDFQKLALFSLGSLERKNTKLPSELKDYDILEVNHSILRSLQTKSPGTIEFQIPGKKSTLTLELIKVNITTDEFSLIEMPLAKKIPMNNTNIHYRGIVKGYPNSLVAISFIGQEISGVISITGNQGNFVIGKLVDSKNHIIYADKDLSHLQDFVCQISDDNVEGYTEEQLSNKQNKNTSRPCPEVFIDISDDVVKDKGGAQQASDYIEALFNQVAVLYDNENITLKLSGVNAWTSTPPFKGLSEYRTYRNNNTYPGQFAHFVAYDIVGGVAYYNVPCRLDFRYGISGIQPNFTNVPTFSLSVYAIAHELGHNFGSRHTNACVWNGNNTAIDGCARPEGGCSRPGVPSDGGTIMSNCSDFGTINFNKGFGPQPGNLIRNTLANASCIVTCNDGGSANTKEWIEVDGLAQQITVDNGGKIWVVNKSGDLYVRRDNRWSIINRNVKDVGATSLIVITDVDDQILYKNRGNNDFVAVEGRAVKVDVDNRDNSWVVNDKDQIFKRIENRYWQQMSGDAVDVGCSGSNSIVYRVAKNGLIYKSEKGNNNWTRISGSNGVRIDVDSQGNAWLVNNKNVLYRYNNSNDRWTLMRDNVQDIGCGTNGEVWITLTDDKIYKWSKNTGSVDRDFPNEAIQSNKIQLYPIPATDKISIDTSGLKGDIFGISIINANGSIIRSLKKSDFDNSTIQTLEISQIPAGMYFVRVNTSDQRIVNKLIIK